MNIIQEMQLCREYCTKIHKARQDAGFVSLRYPLVSVSLNQYFLPEFRELIADECNLVGYMNIPPVEYDPDQKEDLLLDTSKSQWQDNLFETRTKKREEAELKKQ